MFDYSKFEEICNDRNVTPYRVCAETGVATSTITEWKNGTYVPKYDKVRKIADFFNVTVDFFIKG